MRKVHINRLSALLGATLVAIALTGCGSPASLERPTPSPGAETYAITGSCAISQDGDVITVSGTTDVMNGAWIDVSVVAQDSRILDHRTIQKTSDNISEQFTLTEDQLSGVVDMQGFISCAPSYYHSQTSDVYNKYGKKFQNINNSEDANNVIWTNEGVILIFASDWLYGVIPSPTPAPTASPTATPEATPSA